MKKGKDNLIFKYVFRPADGCNDYICNIDGDIRMLSEFFPQIYSIASHCSTYLNIKFDNGNIDTTAWIDKHANIIVRIIDNSFVQSKINF